MKETISFEDVAKSEIGTSYSIGIGRGYRLVFRKDEDEYGKHVHFFLYWRKMPKIDEYYSLTQQEAHLFLKSLLANPPPRTLKITHIVRQQEWFNPQFSELKNNPSRNHLVEFIMEQELTPDILHETIYWVEESIGVTKEPTLEITQFSSGMVHVALPERSLVVGIINMPERYRKMLSEIRKFVTPKNLKEVD